MDVLTGMSIHRVQQQNNYLLSTLLFILRILSMKPLVSSFQKPDKFVLKPIKGRKTLQHFN